MASEDPGVGTLAVILELLQRTGNVITGTIKSGISFSLDVIKTGMFFAWRRQMMQSQKGPDLEHGKQSLKKLREHEQVGAKIVSVSIGDHEAMKALDKELKRLKIDYAITDDGGKGKHPILRYRNNEDKTYTLHYKINNEPDVMLAQANALLQRYGDPSQETPDDSKQEQNQDQSQQQEQARQEQDQNQQQEQNQREQQEQARQEQQQSQEEQARQNQQQEQQEQDQQSQQQQQDEQLREQQEDVPAPGQDKGEEREDRADSTGADKAERTANQPLTVAGAAKDAPVDELQQKLSEFESRSQARTPQQSREAVPSRNASVDELKKHARERAQRKNLSRQQVRKQAHERSLGKSMTRSRHRGLELGH